MPQHQAKKLSQLHVAFQNGSAEAVWSAYLELRQLNEANDGSLSLAGSSVLDGILTPKECSSVLRIIGNDVTKTKRGMNRILRLMSDIRSHQRCLLALLQHASESGDKGRSRFLTTELEAWDRVISPELLNITVSHIGKSLRSVGLDEIEQILDQLLTYDANELSRRKQPSPSRPKHGKQTPALHSAEPLEYLRTSVLSPVVRSALGKRLSGKRLPSDFPDLATYNTILDIITRTVIRSNPSRRTPSKEEHSHDEEEDAMARVEQQHAASRSARLNASLATKLRRFDLDPEAAPLHLDELERADRLFHSVLERMSRNGRTEPDRITFNIMITMYCLLDRWDAVHGVVRSMRDRGLLKIDGVNNVLGHWLMRGPAAKRRKDGGNDEGGDMAMDSVLEVYRQLRQNFVHAELALRHSDTAYGGRNEYSIHNRRSPYTVVSSDGSEPSSTTSFSPSPANASGNEVEAVLGIAKLPLDVVPDEITHALIIKHLTWAGRFADALSVFKDLVSTPTRLVAQEAERAQDRIDAVDATGRRDEEKKMQPTLAIFDSFFRGFAQYGKPSTVVEFDAEHPELSRWAAVPSASPVDGEEDSEQDALKNDKKGPYAQQLQLWRVETFREIFEAFLNFEPDLEQVLRSSEATRRALDRSREMADRTVSTPLGWITLSEKRKVDALRRAPSTNQLFWILTAIRRVSHDHAGWSLAMWQKVVDKFASHDLGLSDDKFAWTGFKVDNRLRRVLDYLHSRLAQERVDDLHD